MTPPAEAPVITSDLNGEDVSKEPIREPDTAVTLTPQALPFPHDEPPCHNCSAGCPDNQPGCFQILSHLDTCPSVFPRPS